MIPIAPPLEAPSCQAPMPALDPERVSQLARLTRDYALLSQGQAGLGSVLGGTFLWLTAVIEALGHHGELTWIGAFRPLPLGAVLAVTSLPFLWLCARYALGIWAHSRFGLVEPPSPSSGGQREGIRALVRRFILPGSLLLGVLPVWTIPLSFRPIRIVLLALLAGAMPFVLSQARTRVDRLAGILLLVGPAMLLAGIQMAALDSLLSFPLVGTWAIVSGFRNHGAFRRVRVELESLRARP